jgi:hypothetical protein
VQYTQLSIFEHGELLFAYFEYHGSDSAADMGKMTACPEIQRWWALMFPMLEMGHPKYKDNDGQISSKFFISTERHEGSRNWCKPNQDFLWSLLGAIELHAAFREESRTRLPS